IEPVLHGALRDEPYSAALDGHGSEEQGYDNPRSTDHAWGPRVRIFLTSDAFRGRAGDLDGRLDSELPVEFCGYPVRFAFPDGAAPRHWVHLTDLTAFFTAQLGVPSPVQMSVVTWLIVPTQVLRELTGG